MNKELRAAISEHFGEDTALFDDCDDAVIGVTNCANSTGQVVYDYEKLVECFIKQGMDPDEAVEWVDFNVAGAGGKGLPLVIVPASSLMT